MGSFNTVTVTFTVGMLAKAKQKASDALERTKSAVTPDDAQTATAQAMADAHMADNRGQMAGNAVNLVVGLTVAGLVAAFLLPIAIDEIVAVDTTSWSGGASSLWDILDVIVVLAVFLFLIGLAMANK